MRVLLLTDRLSARGGADWHLMQVVTSVAAAGAAVTVAYGRREDGGRLPGRVTGVTVRGLGSPVADGSRLGRLARLLEGCDVVHVQNVMNPVALRTAVATGRAVVTVQDHRVFCPGPGRTLPGGERCDRTTSRAACAECLPDAGYLERNLELTRARLEALQGARLVVLSSYMAAELAVAGLAGAEVIPPWFEPASERCGVGGAFLLGGRLVPHKGVMDAWAAWMAAGRPLPLRVAGEGSLAQRLDGAERLGWLGQEALRGELQRARALLFPSFWQEPFGILGVQALAQGTPVVVADNGGTGDWSDAGCIRVAAGDVEAMAGAVQRLVAEPTLALRLGLQGQAMVAERFARREIEPRLLGLYENVQRGIRS
ncbi:MAG: glycosyltransferase [Acidobacteria bacterium]|nr:glycosyltransferase [Acidobacteriota bacterium]